MSIMCAFSLTSCGDKNDDERSSEASTKSSFELKTMISIKKVMILPMRRQQIMMMKIRRMTLLKISYALVILFRQELGAN